MQIVSLSTLSALQQRFEDRYYNIAVTLQTALEASEFVNLLFQTIHSSSPLLQNSTLHADPVQNKSQLKFVTF